MYEILGNKHERQNCVVIQQPTKLDSLSKDKIPFENKILNKQTNVLEIMLHQPFLLRAHTTHE